MGQTQSTQGKQKELSKSDSTLEFDPGKKLKTEEQEPYPIVEGTNALLKGIYIYIYIYIFLI